MTDRPTLFEAIDTASQKDDLNEAVAIVQDALGQEDGGFADLFFSGQGITRLGWLHYEPYWRKHVLAQYAAAEVQSLPVKP